jgi:hypothetical protein
MEEWQEYESSGRIAADLTKVTKWELQKYLLA